MGITRKIDKVEKSELCNKLLFFDHLKRVLSHGSQVNWHSYPISEAEEICIFPPIFSPPVFIKISLDVRLLYLDI